MGETSSEDELLDAHVLQRRACTIGGEREREIVWMKVKEWSWLNRACSLESFWGKDEQIGIFTPEHGGVRAGSWAPRNQHLVWVQTEGRRRPIKATCWRNKISRTNKIMKKISPHHTHINTERESSTEKKPQPRTSRGGYRYFGIYFKGLKRELKEKAREIIPPWGDTRPQRVWGKNVHILAHFGT